MLNMLAPFSSSDSTSAIGHHPEQWAKLLGHEHAHTFKNGLEREIGLRIRDYSIDSYTFSRHRFSFFLRWLN